MTASHDSSMELSYLGPKGTFSEAAALIFQDRLGGPCLSPQPSCPAVAWSVKDPRTYGVLPYYNLLDGLVQETLDLIYLGELDVVDAVRLPISIAAGSRSGCIDLPRVASHPKALRQCSRFLSAKLPRAEQLPVSSTADAAQLARESDIVALASEDALAVHGLRVITRDVADLVQGRPNFTEFLLVGTASPPLRQSACARALVAVCPRQEYPGLLAVILEQFSYYGVNIAKIHSRPALEPVSSAIEPQMFWVEAMSSVDADALRNCLQSISWRFDSPAGPAVRLLGGWPELAQDAHSRASQGAVHPG